MSIRKSIHDNITNRIKALNEYDWIDIWKAQLDRGSNSYPHGFPCAFVSINTINYEDITRNVKEGRVIIDVYLFFNTHGDTFEGASDKAETFAIIDIVERTGEAIHWIEEGETIREITQISEDDLTTRYNRPAYKLSFETIIYQKLNLDNYVYNN